MEIEADRVAGKLIDQITAWSTPQTTRFAKVLGRVIDDRTPSDSPAPWKRNVVAPIPDPDPNPAYRFAWVEEDGAKIPLIESRIIGEGRLTVLHYSPMSFDTLRQDAAFPEVLVRRPTIGPSNLLGSSVFARRELQGLGVQRFLDLTELNDAGSVRSDQAALHGVRETPASDALLLDCWATFDHDRAQFVAPLLVERSSGRTHEAGLVSLDWLSREVTFAVRAKDQTINVGESDLILGDETMPIHSPLVLRPSAFGSTLLDLLRSVASFTGGGEMRRPAELDERLPRRLAQGWPLAAVALPLLAALLVSPLCRSWDGLFAALGRFLTRKPVDFASPEIRAIEIRVQGVMDRWGRHPGMPDARRHAGEQAGRREFRTGDSLSMCLPADLVPFTEANRILKLPPRKPTVRLRQSNRAMHAWILADVGPNLSLPDTADVAIRVSFLVSLCSVAARTTWMQSSGVSVVTLQEPERTLGPLYGVDSSPQMTRLLVQAAARRPMAGKLALPHDCESGQVVYLVSGLVGFRDDEIRQFLLNAVIAGVRLRVLQVVAWRSLQTTGLCLDQNTGAFSDRGNWSEADLRRLYHAMSDDLAARAERSDFRFHQTITSGSLDDAVADLFEADFFR